MQTAEGQEGLEKVALDNGGLQEAGESFFQLPFHVVPDAVGIMVTGVLGTEVHGGLEIGHSSVEPAGLNVENAELVVDVGIAGVEFQRGKEKSLRLLHVLTGITVFERGFLHERQVDGGARQRGAESAEKAELQGFTDGC